MKASSVDILTDASPAGHLGIEITARLLSARPRPTKWDGRGCDYQCERKEVCNRGKFPGASVDAVAGRVGSAWSTLEKQSALRRPRSASAATFPRNSGRKAVVDQLRSSRSDASATAKATTFLRASASAIREKAQNNSRFSADDTAFGVSSHSVQARFAVARIGSVSKSSKNAAGDSWRNSDISRSLSAPTLLEPLSHFVSCPTLTPSASLRSSALYPSMIRLIRIREPTRVSIGFSRSSPLLKYSVSLSGSALGFRLATMKLLNKTRAGYKNPRNLRSKCILN